MNDKCHLWLPYGIYEQNVNFGSNWWPAKNTLTNPKTAEVTESVKHFCNTENFQADLYGGGLSVRMNPNKVAKQTIGSGHLSYENFVSVVKQVESELSETGINCNLLQGRLTRADNSFDLQTSLSYKHYFSLIQTLIPNRIRQGKTKIFENTFYYGSGQCQITIYDKQNESNLSEPMIRFEFRHLKDLKRSKLFLSDVSENRYYQLRTADKDKIESNIFTLNPKILESEYQQYFIQQLETRQPRGIIYQQFTMNVLQSEQQKTGFDVNTLLTNPKSDVNYNRNYRIRTDINSNRRLTPKMIERYNELQTLFKLAV